MYVKIFLEYLLMYVLEVIKLRVEFGSDARVFYRDEFFFEAQICFFR